MKNIICTFIAMIVLVITQFSFASSNDHGAHSHSHSKKQPGLTLEEAEKIYTSLEKHRQLKSGTSAKYYKFSMQYNSENIGVQTEYSCKG